MLLIWLIGVSSSKTHQNLLFITEFSQLIDVVMENEKLESLIETQLVQRHRLTLPAELPVRQLPLTLSLFISMNDVIVSLS